MALNDPTNCFLDTNVWLYAFIETQDQKKSATAKGLIEENGVVVSSQVINEISINLIKKAHFDETRIQRLIASFYARHQVVAIGKEILLKASELRSSYRFSFWDSMIVAGALAAGATILYSEDMDDGLAVGGRLAIPQSVPLLVQESSLAWLR
jgi:predicted nucleic acid-binding protein